MPVVFCIIELDASKMLRVIAASLWRGQHDGLIATESSGLVHGAGVNATKLQIKLATNHEERLCLMQGEPTSEIGEAPIHDIKAARFGNRGVGQIHLVHLAVANVNGGWNVAAQIDNGVRFDNCFGGTEIGTREQGKAQVDGGRVHRVERCLESQADVFVPIEFECNGNQPLPKRFEQTPVATFVSVGQRRFGNASANADVVELGTLGVEASNQIAQTLSPGQLSIGHAQKMAPCRELADTAIHRETIDQMFEMAKGNKFQQLREYGSAMIHLTASPARKNGNDTA